MPTKRPTRTRSRRSSASDILRRPVTIHAVYSLNDGAVVRQIRKAIKADDGERLEVLARGLHLFGELLDVVEVK